MNVETIEVDLALRSPEEGSDLGLQLFRRHARRTLLAGALLMAPIWVLAFALVEVHWALAFAAVWWSKPVVDRIALFVLSRAVFGAPPTTRQTLAAAPGLFDRQLLLALTLQRFIPRRSLYLPVASLEGLRGRALRERFRVVSRHGAARVSMAQTVGWLHIEWALWGGLAWLVTLLLPEGVVPPLLDLTFGTAEATTALTWLYLLTLPPALLVAECAYVASGFGLYLSRRTELEGWDLQLAFERMGARIAATSRGAVAVAVLAAAVLALAAPARAASTQQDDTARQPEPSGAQEPATPREVADAILASDEFDRTREVTSLRPDFDVGAGGAGGLGSALAMLAKIVALAALAAVVIALIVAIARRGESLAAAAPDSPAPRPTEAFGLDLRKESLPADVAAEARRLVEAGDTLPALSLLYRGALVRLVDDHRLPIEAGDTEHDCMERVAGQLGPREPGVVATFRGLTRAWLGAAWGGESIEIESALAHCDAFEATFRAKRVGAA